MMAFPFDDDRNPLIYRSLLSAGELVNAIQDEYLLTPPLECSLLYSGVNDIYLVIAQEQKYILRVSCATRYGAFDENAYRFEMRLLDFLHKKRFPAAYPLARRNKDFLGSIRAPEGKRHYALFNFVGGKAPSSFNEEEGFVLGKTLASFHRLADKFSSNYSRYHLDEEFLIKEPLQRLRRFSKIPKKDLVFLETLAESLWAGIQRLSGRNGEYGIVHGDFWWNNVHFQDGKPILFDFDFCGYGWRSYDIASLRGTAKAFEYGISDEVVDAFLKGYQSIRKLTEAELAAISAFEKIRILWAFGLWTEASKTHGAQWFYEMYTWVFSNLKKLLEEENGIVPTSAGPGMKR